MATSPHTNPRRRRPRGRARRAVAASLLLVAACTGSGDAGAEDPAPTAAGEPAGADARPAQERISAARSAATASLEDVLAAMEAEDFDTVLDGSTGPAATYFTHVRDVASVSVDGTVMFPNLRWELDGAAVEEGLVRFPGAVTWGDHEGAPPVTVTDLEVAESDGRWQLAAFVRDGHPIADWVAPPASDEILESGPISVEPGVVFVDMGCFSGSDQGCPEVAVDLMSITFYVTNGSDAPLEPAPVPSPIDGEEQPAWLVTPDGTAIPFFDAALVGFPPGDEPHRVMAMFQAARQLEAGGTVHIALSTEDGMVHAFEVPVPTFPYDWDGAVDE